MRIPVVLLGVGAWWYLTGGRYVSTDDAYVQQDRVTITPQVTGRIVTVMHRENDSVAAGDVLFVIDPQPYRIGLDAAESALASARLTVEQLRSTYQQAMASLKAAEDDVAFKQRGFDRQQGLLAKGIATQASYDQADNDLHTAQQNLAKAQESGISALAALGGNASIATDDHPAVRVDQSGGAHADADPVADAGRHLFDRADDATDDRVGPFGGPGGDSDDGAGRRFRGREHRRPDVRAAKVHGDDAGHGGSITYAPIRSWRVRMRSSGGAIPARSVASRAPACPFRACVLECSR
jgi:hypothetical protein